MTLYPIAEVDGDRLVLHPGGRVLLRISKYATVAFPDEAALDAFLEELDRERSPGRDPWRQPEVDAFHTRFQGLTEQPRTRLRTVG